MANSSHSHVEPKSLRTIALIGNLRAADAAQALQALAQSIIDCGGQVLIEAETARFAAMTDFFTIDFTGIDQKVDAVVVVGGDGAMLNAARRLAALNVPLVGVNLGRVGFMTDIARQNMSLAVKQLLAGEFTRERRFMLTASVQRNREEIFSAPALNDVVVSKGAIGRMVELNVKVDDEFLFVLRADGIIVATPTGSTAYAMSANGPILHPNVAGIAVVPLCPHALSNRPITIGDNSCVQLRLIGPHEGSVHCDGREDFALVADDVVVIKRAAHYVTFLHPPGYSYFAMLREKLHWSATPKN